MGGRDLFYFVTNPYRPFVFIWLRSMLSFIHNHPRATNFLSEINIFDGSKSSMINTSNILYQWNKTTISAIHHKNFFDGNLDLAFIFPSLSHQLSILNKTSLLNLWSTSFCRVFCCPFATTKQTDLANKTDGVKNQISRQQRGLIYWRVESDVERAVQGDGGTNKIFIAPKVSLVVASTVARWL